MKNSLWQKPASTKHRTTTPYDALIEPWQHSIGCKTPASHLEPQSFSFSSPILKIPSPQLPLQATLREKQQDWDLCVLGIVVQSCLPSVTCGSRHRGRVVGNVPWTLVLAEILFRHTIIRQNIKMQAKER